MSLATGSMRWWLAEPEKLGRTGAMKKTTAKKTARATKKEATGFSDFEKSAMKERAAELKAEARRGKSADREAQAERDLLAAIAAMGKTDRGMAERLHAIIKAAAPGLSARTWYGMPAYARDDKVVCFFQPAEKFKARYATLGFSDEAKLDDGALWPTSFAVTELTSATAAKIAALVKKAVG